MEKKEYAQLNEVFYQETLANGLQVTLLPKADYHKTYGLFTTNYGSIDNEFIPLGQTEFVHVPDGIAHFLEHKLFEKEEGDVFQTFGKQGASANAFTSFTHTSYLFSSTEQVYKNLETLINFVQEPYFTKETVEKEKGIIGQEIQMYQDDPNWRLFFGIINNLYPEHPLHIDIAGTEASIAEITAEDLYLCYTTFYHPSNMHLLVVGNLEPEAMMTFIRENQAKKAFAPAQKIERRFPKETSIVKESQIKMSVNRAKAVIGIKGLTEVPSDSAEAVRYKFALQLLLELLFGNTSQNYLQLYDEGIIDDSFGYELNMERNFYFGDISSDTSQPEQFAQAIIQMLTSYETSAELTEEKVALLKKKRIGSFLHSLNSLEYMANQFSQNQAGEITLFDHLPILESLQLADIQQAAQKFIKEEAISKFYMYPNDEK